jgi:uncharacterized membrane protein (Fun14 family)
MIQLQVKAKSGLHAGAVWNLSKSYITVGGSSRADIFLCDPEMPDTLVTLCRYGRRYVIEGMDPSAKLISHNNQKTEKTIFPSQTLTVDFRNTQLDLSLVNSNQGLGINDALTRFFHGILRLLQGFGAKAIISMLFLVGVLLTVIVLFFGENGVAKINDNTISKKKETTSTTEQEIPLEQKPTIDPVTPEKATDPLMDVPQTSESTNKEGNTTSQ